MRPQGDVIVRPDDRGDLFAIGVDRIQVHEYRGDFRLVLQFDHPMSPSVLTLDFGALDVHLDGGGCQ